MLLKINAMTQLVSQRKHERILRGKKSLNDEIISFLSLPKRKQKLSV